LDIHIYLIHKLKYLPRAIALEVTRFQQIIVRFTVCT